MADAVMLGGVVEAGEVSHASLRVGPDVKAAATPSGQLVLALDGGGRLTVEIASSTEIQGSPHTQRGVWSELREQPAAAGLPRDAVQPFTEVELGRITLAQGSRVVVWGEVTERGFAADGGLRSAPSQPPTRLRADVLATGAQAQQLVERAVAARRPAPPPPTPRAVATDAGDPATPIPWDEHLMMGLVLFAGGLALMYGFVHAPYRFYSHMTMIALVVLAAAFTVRGRREIPVFWLRDRPRTLPGDSWWVVGPRILCFLANLVVVNLADQLAPASAVWPGVLLGILALWAVTVLSEEHASFALLGRLVGAPRAAPGSADGQWVTFEGSLRSRTLDAPPGEVILAASTQSHVPIGKYSPKQPDQYAVRGGGLYFIEAGGAVVAVDPEETTWASRDLMRSGGRHALRVTVEQVIASGGRAAASGRLVATPDGQVALRSAGTQPAIVLATSGDGRPLAYARAVRRHRAISLLALLLAAGGVVAIYLRVRAGVLW